MCLILRGLKRPLGPASDIPRVAMRFWRGAKQCEAGAHREVKPPPVTCRRRNAAPRAFLLQRVASSDSERNRRGIAGDAS